jgi:ABC-type transport system involved in multi-copper enzyme maturation permease subunit
VELRKTLDTRAGRWLLVVLGVLAAAGLAYRLWHAADGPITFEGFYGTALAPVQQLLPVLGVLAMTSEWTQRTALTTFTLVPQRGRVVAAKLAAALVLTAAMVLLIAAASALAAGAAGLATGDPVHWGGVAHLVGGAAASYALSMLMGAGFGALLQLTPAALVLYFVAPALVAAAAGALFSEGARWVDVHGALGRVSELDLTGAVAPTLVALAAWIVLPLGAGVVRTLRREVS